MALSLRAKILIGIALACAGYVVLVPGESQPVEAQHVGSAERAAPTHTPKAHATHAVRMAALVTDRSASSALAGSLFHVQSWYVPPPPPPPAPPPPYVPPPPPTAPPLPFAFMGSYKTEDGASTYYLMSGDRVFDVKIGDHVDSTYSVDGVEGGQLLLTYMPLKIQQSLAVGDE